LHWQNLNNAVDDDPQAKSATDAFWQTYQHFLKIDAALLEKITKHKTLRYLISQRMEQIKVIDNKINDSLRHF